MAFELQVEFTGVCLNVLHTNGKQVAVLLPDCRGGGNHADGDPALPHAGFVQFDAGFAIPALPLGDLTDPRSVVVHRFDGDVLELPIVDDNTAIEVKELFAPELAHSTTTAGAAESVELIPGLFGATPTNLLARCILTNGAFTAQPDAAMWEFSSALRPSGPKYEAVITHKVVWHHMVDQTVCTLVIRSFDGARKTNYELTPRAGADGKEFVRIRVANLCEGNPLEWSDLPDPRPVSLDVDFKWFYSLLQSTTPDSIPARLGSRMLPIPELKQGGAGTRNCPGSRISSTF